MNICTPGNCICDAAEWPGDTNCMGEVVGVDPWKAAGMELISGQENDSNSRSRSEQTEFPVKNKSDGISGRELMRRNTHPQKPVSIRESKDSGVLKPNTSVRYTPPTDETPRDGARSPQGAAVVNEQTSWEVDAMEYFNGRLDDIQSVNKGVSDVLEELSSTQARLETMLGDTMSALHEIKSSLDERSESASAGGVSVVPSVTVTLEDVPADIAEVLQAELRARIERLVKFKNARTGR